MKPERGWEGWRMVLKVSALLVITIGIVLTLMVLSQSGPYSLTPFPRWAISSAFDGQTNPLQNPKLEIECRGFSCEEVIPYLPAVSHVKCVQEMFPLGACCHTGFGEVTGSEVHIWWKGFGRYKISLTSPGCPNPEFDPTADPKDSASKEWIPCDAV